VVERCFADKTRRMWTSRSFLTCNTSCFLLIILMPVEISRSSISFSY
jgi:hypothetical protein